VFGDWRKKIGGKLIPGVGWGLLAVDVVNGVKTGIEAGRRGYLADPFL